MASVAGGLSRVGKIPFINSFSAFCCGRAYDQIRQSISIGKLNVKICGSSAGCSDFGDGATHQSIDDIAYMRVIPNMQVIVPADANEAIEVTKYMAESKGPVYMRLNRNDYPNVTEEGKPFVLGQPTVLREGTDVCVFACGVMVGIEFIKMLCKPSAENVIEVLVFLIARHMIIGSNSALDILLSVVSVALLYGVRLVLRREKAKKNEKPADV